MSIFSRRIHWDIEGWGEFFLAGGMLTADAWERATPKSRGACLLAAKALRAFGAPGPEPVDPSGTRIAERAACLAVGQEMAEAAAAGGAPA